MMVKYSYKSDLEFIEKFFDIMQNKVPSSYYPYIKSLRRPKSVCDYLTALYISEGERTPSHYIAAARYTVIPELQDLAEEVARKVLFQKKTENSSNRKKSDNQSYDEMEEIKTGTKASYGPDKFLKWTERYEPLDKRELMETIKKISRYFYIKFNKKKKESADYKLKPFQVGDDPNSIDYDATIQNIHSQGKKIDQLRNDDFLVRKLRKRRYCVIFLHDISTSMNNKIFYTNTIVSSLIQLFRDDEIAIGLFGKDFYTMKDLDNNENIDRLSFAVLGLKANGGTMLIRGMDWVYEQFDSFSSEMNKICIIISDFKIFAPQLTYEKVKDLILNNVKIIGISTNEAQNWLENTGTPVVEMTDILKRSDKAEFFLSEVLEKIYKILY